MHSDKKLSMEDTWRPAELKRHLRDERPGGEYIRRRSDNERKHRGGESVERRRRDPEKESRRERDEQKERGSTKERRHDEGKDGYAKPKEDSRDRRSDKDRDRRDEERRKERDRPVDDVRKRDREDKRERDRDKERHRDKERDRVRDRDGEERDKRREERDKERRREERDKDRRREGQDGEHREKRRHEESGDGGRDRERERPKDERDKERRERHKGEREHREEHKGHKEDRERRHKERGHDDQRQKHDAEPRRHRDSKRPAEEERHHRGDGEQQQQQQERGEKHKERRHREEDDVEKKHRERRHREEEEDAGRIHKDRSKKETSEKSQRHETNTVKTQEFEMVSEHQTSIVKDVGDTEEPVVNDEDLAEQEYEDDFEDYEEDFEDIDPSEGEDEKEPEFPQVEEKEEGKDELTAQKRKEIEAIRRAMNEENERVGTVQRGEEDTPKLSKGSERSQSRASQRGRFIDFVAAKQREVSKKVATKQKKRSTELLRLIDLDFSMTASLLDLPPVNEYDMYIRTFGNANTKQAYVQCNEDNADRDVQTEEIEVCEKWTQHPPEYSGSCGDPNLSQEARDKNMNEINFDSQRLASFLLSASQVMVVLLEENQAERKSLRKLRNQTDTLSFSDGSSQLNTQLSFLCGRHISLVHFSQVQSHTMMSVHAPTTTPSAVRLDSCTIICIWNIWEPSRPQRILVYESEVQCCCFSPGKATLVFAGTSVGSVVLWDLRELAANHYCLKIGEDEWTFRQPTFSTDAVMASSGHFSSVSSVEVVPSTAADGGLRPEIPLLASEEESSGLSFQLASLDESGVLNFWVVVELPKASEAGSSTDLGLRPGGKVKLLHSSTLHTAERVSSRDAVKIGSLQSLHLKFLPSDSNHFFIGTNMGLVRHGTSHGLKAPPKFYRFQEAGVRPVDVSVIHFSPFRQNLFLVGCGDGCIRLHAVSREQPVAEWSHSTAGERVVSLQWAQTRPTVFCVLDAASNLHIWDLLRNDTKPVITERISADRLTAMTVFGDSGKQNTYSGIALVHGSGNIEMHYFTRDFTVSSCAEEEKLERMMTEAL